MSAARALAQRATVDQTVCRAVKAPSRPVPTPDGARMEFAFGCDFGDIPLLRSGEGANQTKLAVNKPREVHGGNAAGTAAPHIVAEVLRSPSQPLDAAMRSQFEHCFQHDFGAVRVHTDDLSAASARAQGAAAYTVGPHLVFAPRRYDPNSPAGRRLIAHELAHVIQQTGSGAPPGRSHEIEAEAAADAVTTGLNPEVHLTSKIGIAARPEEGTSSTLVDDKALATVRKTLKKSDPAAEICQSI